MGTNIRPRISERNPSYISKHRYYELKHFVMQYPEWKQEYRKLGSIAGGPPTDTDYICRGGPGDPTARAAERRLYLAERIHMVDAAAEKAAGAYAEKLIQAITEELSYEKLNAREPIPFCKDIWYEKYRIFFWELSKLRN